MRARLLLALATPFCLPAGLASAETQVVCTIIADAASGKVLKEEGACDTRATAASTFKLPISLMGYDAGILKTTHEPVWPFKKGYPDWRAEWKGDIDPAKWMKESVVWYSQQITTRLGAERFAAYVRDFGYGNADVSGDPGKKNGLTRSWLTSSLEISPREQVAFLGRMVRHELGVAESAYTMTAELALVGDQPNGWTVHGKTGSGPSKNADGSKSSARPWGWFVGWATKGDRTVVFARLTKDTTKPSKPSGPAARDAILSELFSKPGQF